MSPEQQADSLLIRFIIMRIDSNMDHVMIKFVSSRV